MIAVMGSEMEAKHSHTSVSAVIPAYNSAAFISDAIQSALAQTVELAEIIVIDDGSSDDTAAVAARFPKTRVIRQQNAGQGAARNAGIRVAVGEWIALLDADDVWLPRKTEAQLECIQADTGVVHCNRFDTIDFGELWHRHVFISPSGALVRRQTILEVGGFEESRSVKSVEDLNLWLKIALTPWRFVRSESSLFEYRMSGQNESSNDFKMAGAELANLAMVGELVQCDPAEVDRISQATRIEYAKNLVSKKRWEEAGQLLKACKPGLATRWLSLAAALKINRMGRNDVVRRLQRSDEGNGSHVCAGTCNLPDAQRAQCIEASRKLNSRVLESR